MSSLRNDQGLWKVFVPVKFQVDYWNYLGWKDRFSTEQFSQRQRDYSQSKNLNSVYTPGVLSGGMEWRRWSSEKIKSDEKSLVGTLVLNLNSKNKIQLIYTPSLNVKNKAFKAYLALQGNRIQSQIRGGENAGKLLTHDFVALELKTNNMLEKDNSYSTEFDMESLPKLNRDPVSSLAAWVTATDNPTVIQAVGGDL